MAHVLLIGPRDDLQLQAVCRSLEARDAQISWWDCHQWPGGEARITLATDGAAGARVCFGSTSVEEVDAAYIRNLGLDPLYERFQDELDARPFSFINQLREYRGLIVSALRALEASGTLMVNPSDSIGVHGTKPWQMVLFQRAGLPVPESLTTNDPDQVMALIERLGEVIFKPVSGGGYARLLRRGEVDRERLSLLANAPVLFQQRIKGDNLRLFVLDGRVIAAGRIITDQLDYRVATHDVQPFEPSPALAQAACRAAALCNLRFSGVDVLQEPSGRFYLLEANPSPMFATFDALADTRVGDQLAAYLVATAEERAP